VLPPHRVIADNRGCVYRYYLSTRCRHWRSSRIV